MSATAVCGGSPAYLGEHALDLSERAWTAVVGAACLVLGAVIRALWKPSAPAEMVAAATEAAKTMFAGMERRLEELEARSAKCEADGRVMAARLDTVEGENRQLQQQKASLVDELRSLGIDVTARENVGALTVIEGSRTTMYRPTPNKPKE